jgi:hypothetical protein
MIQAPKTNPNPKIHEGIEPTPNNNKRYIYQGEEETDPRTLKLKSSRYPQGQEATEIQFLKKLRSTTNLHGMIVKTKSPRKRRRKNLKKSKIMRNPKLTRRIWTSQPGTKSKITVVKNQLNKKANLREGQAELLPPKLIHQNKTTKRVTGTQVMKKTRSSQLKEMDGPTPKNKTTTKTSSNRTKPTTR